MITSPEEIKNFWQAASHTELDQDGLRATARDPYLQYCVESAMKKHFWSEAHLLDVGCGDGVSTLLFSKLVKQSTGIDYIENNIVRAQKKAIESGVKNATFKVADITNLGPLLGDVKFDIVTSIRCLINLPTWELQQLALRQIAMSVESGGLFLVSEGWEENWSLLNLERNRVFLETMNIAKYNCLISRLKFEEEIKKNFIIEDYHSLGFYIFISRIFQPSLKFPDAPCHNDPINKVGAQLQGLLIDKSAFQNLDYAGVYVCRKK